MKSQSDLKRIPRNLIITFVLVVLGLGGAGYLFYVNQKNHIRKEKLNELAGIADLKVKEIANWRSERMGDAQVIFEDPDVSRRVQRLFESSPPLSSLRNELLIWMESRRKNHQYKSILLLDGQGLVRLSVNANDGGIDSQVRALAVEAMQTREVAFSDLRRDKKTDEIDLDIFVPLITRQGEDSLSIGAFVLRIDPDNFLYPMIQSWPTPSQTAEMLLVRREGNDVVFLNELRHTKSIPLSLRLPLSQKTLPAALAVVGEQGIVAGTDYRGVPVMAALRTIAGSPWALVAKVDEEEIYRPIHERGWFAALAVIVLIIAAGAGIVVIWREQRAQFYRRLYEAEVERQALAKHYEYLLKYANDIILMVDAQWKIVDANDRALSAYGYGRNELFQLSLRVLHAPEAQVSLDEQMRQLTEREGLVFESIHQRKDGTVFPVEVSSRIIRVEGQNFYQSIVRDITERKEAEHALAAERSLLRTIMDTLPDRIYIKDVDSRFVVNNISHIRALGVQTQEQVTGRTDFDFRPRDLAARYFADDQYVIRSGQPLLNREEPTLFPSGETGWHLATKVPWRNPQGKIIGLVGISHDITERKREQEELERVNRALKVLSESNQALIHHSEECSLLKDICRIIVDIGGYRFAWIGFAEEDQQKRVRAVANAGHEEGYLDVVDVTWEDTERGLGPVGTAIRTREVSIVRDVLSDPGSTPWSVEAAKRGYASVIALPIIGGEQVLGALAIYAAESDAFDGEEIDLLKELSADLSYGITSLRVRAEHAKAEAALTEERTLLRTLIDNLPDAIFVKDGESRFVITNISLSRLLGVKTQDEAIGKTDFDFFPEEVASQYFADEQSIIKTGQPIINREEPMTDRTGNRRWMLTTKVPLGDGGGKIVGLMGIIRDITGRKRLEQQLLQAQKMESLGTLAGGIAHDFNNVLGIITGYASKIQGDEVKPGEVASSVGAINKAVGRGAGLVRQLLTFARKAEVQFQSVRINEVVEELVKLVKETFPETITLSLELDESVPSIIADPNQLHQALLNLFINARDAMLIPSATGSIGGTLTVKTETVFSSSLVGRYPNALGERYVCVTVRDTGVGMDETTRSHIFEPFFTTKGLGGGTGLGLSVVYGIVESHRGFIDVESEISKGTAFRLFFPIQPPGVERFEKEAKIVEEPIGGTETILVVEDEELLLDLLKTVLEAKGYQVLFAKDGLQALDVYQQREKEIALILMDIGLPKLSGWEVLRRMKEMNSKVRVILASGYIDPHMKSELLKAGAKYFIQKPYVLKEVLQRVREVIDRSEK
jgi:PAS domain S-box-containing protein